MAVTTVLAIEREIVEMIAAAKLRLRFDKVALRLVDVLKTALVQIVPEDQAIIFALAAPIRHPAKTASVIERLVRDGLPDSEVCKTILGNQVRLRHIVGVPANMPRVMGFVHNEESDASYILKLVETRLLE